MHGRNITPPDDLSLSKAVIRGIVNGGITFLLSFSVVSIVHTIVGLNFERASLITIIATALSQLIAGYLHAFASHVGMVCCKHLFGGVYRVGSLLSNTRGLNETRTNASKRFFKERRMNAVVLNFMWETFTIFYLLQSILLFFYFESGDINIMDLNHTNDTIWIGSSLNSESQIILIHGVTRFFAGCLAGMSTGVINQCWLRYQYSLNPNAVRPPPDHNGLEITCESVNRILAPSNIENWIKLSTMIASASFTIIASVLGHVDIYLFSAGPKRFFGDLLIINAGWLGLRDLMMIMLKRPTVPEATLATPQLNTEINNSGQYQMQPISEEQILLNQEADV